jgi:hypothetical protein
LKLTEIVQCDGRSRFPHAARKPLALGDPEPAGGRLEVVGLVEVPLAPKDADDQLLAVWHPENTGDAVHCLGKPPKQVLDALIEGLPLDDRLRNGDEGRDFALGAALVGDVLHRAQDFVRLPLLGDLGQRGAQVPS